MTKIENAAEEVLSAEEVVLLNKIEKAVFDNIVMRHGDYEAAHKATLDRDDAEQGLRKLAMEATRRGDIEHFNLLLNETTARMERATRIAGEVEVAAGEDIMGEKEYQPFGSGSLVAENNKAEEVKASEEDAKIDNGGKEEKVMTQRVTISKTDYNVLQSCIEKYSNGQHDILDYTQRMAVKVLGAKIPQSVFEAENNYKAFDMWLGSEINPKIEMEDGHKEEIRVFDNGGYDFFYAEEDADKADKMKVRLADLKTAEEKAESKTYFIEVYTNEEGNNENDAEFVAQYEYESLLSAYDAAAEVKEEFEYADFCKLEIVDSEDENRVYYELGKRGGQILEPELKKVLEEREVHSASDVEQTDVEQTDDVEEVIADEIDSVIEDKLFAQAEFINTNAEAMSDSAAAIEGGDICIEGKIVNIPDKKGKARYYIYSWDSCGANQYDTELGLINEKIAREIAAKWHLALSPMSFEEYMKASNAEYRKIRTLYLEKGGGIARDYDAELFREVQANRAQIDCLDDYVVTLDYDEMAEIEEVNAEVAEKEPTLIDKLRAKVKEQRERHRSIIDWEATFADMRFEELKRMQSEMRRCLRIGETELAASIFNNAKRFFKAA